MVRLNAVPSKERAYHDTKTQAERSGKECIAFTDLEIVHSWDLPYDDIDAYYTGPETACCGLSVCCSVSPKQVPVPTPLTAVMIHPRVSLSSPILAVWIRDPVQ